MLLLEFGTTLGFSHDPASIRLPDGVAGAFGGLPLTGLGAAVEHGGLPLTGLGDAVGLNSASASVFKIFSVEKYRTGNAANVDSPNGGRKGGCLRASTSAAELLEEAFCPVALAEAECCCTVTVWVVSGLMELAEAGRC